LSFCKSKPLSETGRRYANDLYAKSLTKKRGWIHRIIETTTKDSSGQSHKRTEVVWMNKYFQKAQAANTVPIVLTKKETKQKKLNPLRMRVRKTRARK
jgi:DNA adenine methylase